MQGVEPAIELRHRSMSEASDLGVALARSLWPSLWLRFLPVYACVVALAFACSVFHTWMPSLLLFLFKPWLDRTLLFVLSRAVFGRSTSRADLWRHRKAVWGSQLWTTFVRARLSPWRSFVMPVVQLEGQRGMARRQRRRLMLRGWRFSAAGMHLAFYMAEFSLNLGLAAGIVLLVPQGVQSNVFELFADWLFRDSTSFDLVMAGAYAVAVFVLEPFYVAAGFAMYLNRRVELESWDVEQELRRVFPR